MATCRCVTSMANDRSSITSGHGYIPGIRFIKDVICVKKPLVWASLHLDLQDVKFVLRKDNLSILLNTSEACSNAKCGMRLSMLHPSARHAKNSDARKGGKQLEMLRDHPCWKRSVFMMLSLRASKKSCQAWLGSYHELHDSRHD